MKAKLKKLALMLTIIILSLSLPNMKIAFPESSGGKIDLFTQKEPYSGKGPNTRSDAFGLGEEVQVYALTTYNEYPVSNLLVAFQIIGPHNPIENITFVRSALTNEDGLAKISFRIALLNETTFGDWTVIGSVRIGDVIVQDSVVFKVGWIVKIESLRTINEAYLEQESFTRGSILGVNIALRSIAMTEKTAMLVIAVYDNLNVCVNAVKLQNFSVPPNETLAYANVFLYLPKTAYVGSATVYACAYTALPELGGVPYCPEVLKSFIIIGQLYFLDVRTIPSNVVTIFGEGWYGEGTTVSLTAPDIVLVSFGIRYKFAYWDVDGISQVFGVHSINVFMNANHTATAHYILQYYLIVDSPYGSPEGAGWYDAGSTTYARLNIEILDHKNGTRRVFICWNGNASGTNYAQSNPIVMDGPKNAIANWKTQHYLAIRTDPFGIATISGEGWYDESSSVTVTAPMVSGYSFQFWEVDGVVQAIAVNSITVHMAAPHNLTAHYLQIVIYTLTITATVGGTTNPAPGTYTYSAGQTVQVRAIPSENYTFDHWELDGVNVGSTNPFSVLMNQNHNLKAVFVSTTAGWVLPWWFFLVLLSLLVLVILPLLIWLYLRRRKKGEEAFRSGWTAWYYCYDLRKIRKV
ncbi:MAG: hypothetical protein QXL57_07590 [Candidatus Bathyarchaeia archaeon]